MTVFEVDLFYKQKNTKKKTTNKNKNKNKKQQQQQEQQQTGHFLYKQTVKDMKPHGCDRIVSVTRCIENIQEGSVLFNNNKMA